MPNKRQTAKKRQRELELKREEKRKEFEKQYHEKKERWEKYGLDSLYELDFLESFIGKKLDEWDSQQLKVPTGKYQDRKKILSTHQQKFVEYIQQLCPSVIEELRAFVPLFDKLFGENKDKYIDIFNRDKGEIFALDYSFNQTVNYSILRTKFLEFRPDRRKNFSYDYHWGEYRILFHFLYVLLVSSLTSEKKTKIALSTIEMLRSNLVIHRDYSGFPKDIDVDDASLLYSATLIICEEILINDEHKYFREDAKQKLTKFLQDISPTPETSIEAFIELQVELLNWAEAHKLKKDWLLRYAYFFLSQFSNNPNQKVSEIEIPALAVRSLVAPPFEFEFEGWVAGDEKKKDYEKRLRESFESAVTLYFHNAGVDLGLGEEGEVKKTTRPIDYDLLKLLVRKTVQNWNEEKIVELDYGIIDSLSTKKYFQNKVKYLKDELPRFKDFSLPYED